MDTAAHKPAAALKMLPIIGGSMKGVPGSRGGWRIRSDSAGSATKVAAAARSIKSSIKMIWMGAKGTGTSSSTGLQGGCNERHLAGQVVTYPLLEVREQNPSFFDRPYD